MPRLNVKCPINKLSFGNVSVNILRELFKKGIDLCIFPTGQPDLSSYDLVAKEFYEWLRSGMSRRLLDVSRSSPTLNIWHINGSESKISDKNILLTFHETGNATPEELNLVKLYDKVCFSSNYAREAFQNLGATNVTNVPIGLDPDLSRIQRRRSDSNIHFGLMGKWEARKHTSKIIKCWAKTYGNNSRYELSCCVENSFLEKSQLESAKLEALGSQEFSNINFLPWLPKNSQVNDFLNSIDIDLSGMSGAEGWNLPAFNATALGKWSIVLDCTSHKDWANAGNCILVSPAGTENIEDGVFFLPNTPFNVGKKYTFNEDSLVKAMELAEHKCKTENIKGIELATQFTYSNTVDKLLDICFS